MSEYKHPEVLVSTDWAAQNLNSPNLRFIEVDVDTTAYDQGHIPGAVAWNWQTQLQDGIRRDLIDKPTLERLLSACGISNDTTILLYGDNNNWFAAYALWQLKLPPTSPPRPITFRALTSLCALARKKSSPSSKAASPASSLTFAPLTNSPAKSSPLRA